MSESPMLIYAALIREVLGQVQTDIAAQLKNFACGNNTFLNLRIGILIIKYEKRILNVILFQETKRCLSCEETNTIQIVAIIAVKIV